MTNRSGLGRSTAYMAGVGAVGLNSVVVWPLLGRVSTLSDFALMVALFATAALLAPVATLGVHAYVLRYLAGGTAEESHQALSVARVALTCFVVVTLILTITNVWVQVPVLITWTAAQGTALIASAILRGLDLAFAFATHALMSQSLSLLVLYVLMWQSVPLHTALLAGAVLIAASSAGIVAATAPRQRGGSLQGALRFSIPLVPHLVLAVGAMQLIRFVVASRGTALEISNFQYSCLLAGAGLTTVQGLSAHLTTDALRHDATRFDAEIARVQDRLFTYCSIFLAGLGVFAWTLIGFWLPPKVDPDTILVCACVMSVAAFAQVRGDMAMASLMWARRTASVSIGSAAGMVASIMVFAVLTALDCDVAIVGSVSVAAALATRAGVTSSRARRVGVSVPPVPKRPRIGWLIGSAGVAAIIARLWVS